MRSTIISIDVGTHAARTRLIFGLTGGALANDAHPDRRRGGDRRRTGRIPTDNEVPQSDARSVRQRPRRSGRRFGKRERGLGFTPDQQASLPPDIALAYDRSVQSAAEATNFDQRWSAGARPMAAPATPGRRSGRRLQQLTTQTYGYAAGMDYHYAPYGVAGFALAGGGTSWGLQRARHRLQPGLPVRRLRHRVVRPRLSCRRAVVHQQLVYDQSHRARRPAAGELRWAELRRPVRGRVSLRRAANARGDALWRRAIQDFQTPSYSEADPPAAASVCPMRR